ncbi:MAG: hypothetical protein HOQ22_04950 [Nocardioidaceae bacterium]|nr:hypothetical protein [Nocardioidaceae bacterium]NUS50374.1 hypothetical protein [Nocardioidaceae bacterium]
MNLRVVAWCAPCWRDRHAEPFLPEQRRPDDEHIAPQRRWGHRDSRAG